MPTMLLQQAGSRGRHLNHPLLLFRALFLLVLVPTPGQTAIHIPENYHVKQINTPPQITAQPESIIAFSSDDIMLKCEASGNPPPTFRWVKDGVAFDPSSISGVTTSLDSGSFVVKDAPIHQFHGNYTCLVSNGLGTAVSNEVHIITEVPGVKYSITSFAVCSQKTRRSIALAALLPLYLLLSCLVLTSPLVSVTTVP